MKVLITGGAGFIGSYVCRELLGKGYDVVVLDNFSNYVGLKLEDYLEALRLRFDGISDDVKFIPCDVTNYCSLKRHFKEQEPDYVIHLAAIPLAPYSNAHPKESLDVNLKGTMNVLEATRSIKPNRFVFASSSFVYGNFQYSPADEKHQCKPIDLYGGAKMASEILVRSYSTQFDIDYTIIRPSAVYGFGDVNRRVVQIFVEAGFSGGTVYLENGGKSKVDFSYVKDVAHGFVLSMESDKAVNETFNLTRGEGRSIKELYDVVHANMALKMEYRDSGVVRPERGALDISKARKLLGYKPKYSLEEGIREYVGDMRGVSDKFRGSIV